VKQEDGSEVVGFVVGLRVGLFDGLRVGLLVGLRVGLFVGLRVGSFDGLLVGFDVGLRLGIEDGSSLALGWVEGLSIIASKISLLSTPSSDRSSHDILIFSPKEEEDISSTVPPNPK